MSASPKLPGASSTVRGVLLVGAGQVGVERAAAVSLIKRFRLVAVCDRNPKQAEVLAARHHAVAVPDLAAGLDLRGVDLVIIATPPADHAATVRQAIAAGKWILCEAPLTTHARSGRILTQQAATAQLRLATSAPHRFEPPVRDALALADAGALGRIESVRLEVGHRASLNFLQSWRTEVAHAGGGCLMHHGPVGCDLIRRFLGEVVLAKGFVRQDVHLPSGCESAAYGLFRNYDNAFAELHVSWNLPRAGVRMELRGETGWLKVETRRPRLAGRLSGGSKVERRYLADRVLDRVHQLRFGCRRSVVAELMAFAASSAEPIASGWEGQRVTGMIEAIYQSDRTGDEVPIKPHLDWAPCAAGA